MADLVHLEGSGSHMNCSIKEKTFVMIQCKDVGSDSMCLRDALSAGILVWKVSKILAVSMHCCYET